MSLKERVYSVLVVSAAENFTSSLLSLLPGSQYDPILTVSNVSAARRALLEREFDFIMVNSPLSDGDGVRFAIDACQKGAVVLLFARSEMYEGIFDKVAEHGVFTLPKPTSRPIVAQGLGWMISARERLRRLEKKTVSIEEKMAEIRLVNHAKWLLIEKEAMSEPDAHRYIEKQAMDRCVSRKEVAEEIIARYP